MKLFGRFFRSTSGRVVLAVVASVAISVPVSVWAVTTFTDVPTSHPFYKEISAVAGAGIAQGFGDGTYRPANDITRQAMAAFMERGVGRVALGEGSTYVETNVLSEVAALSIDAGATGTGTNGFTLVSASLYAGSTASTLASCPCVVGVNLLDGDTTISQSFILVPQLPDGEYSAGATTLQKVMPVDGDSAHVYRLVVTGSTSFGETLVTAVGSISATYVPLSGDGDNTSDYDLSCPKDDAWEEDDTLGTAGHYFMSSSQALNGIVCPGDSDHYFDSVALGSTTIEVHVSFAHLEGDIDVCLYEFSTQLACSAGSGNTEDILYPAAPGGTYTIRVFLFSDTGVVTGSPYTLTASSYPT